MKYLVEVRIEGFDTQDAANEMLDKIIELAESAGVIVSGGTGPVPDWESERAVILESVAFVDAQEGR